MLKNKILAALVVATLLCPFYAFAEKVDAKNISNSAAQCGKFLGHPDWCIGFPEGTINLTIAPDNEDAPESISSIYVIAAYEGKFYSYNSRTTDPDMRWIQVKAENLPGEAAFVRAPFDSPVLTRQIYMGNFAKLKNVDIYVGAGFKDKTLSSSKLKKSWTNL